MSYSKSEKILQKLIEMENSKVHSKYWNVSYTLGNFLKNLVEIREPKRILEIGTSNGFSTLFLALGSLNYSCKIDTIDIDSNRLDEAKRNFNILDLTNVIDCNLGDCFEVVNQELKKNKYDFVFIDAAHKNYLELFDLINKNEMLLKDYIVIFDNVISHSYMKNFIEEMKTKYNCTLIDVDSGFLVVQPWN